MKLLEPWLYKKTDKNGEVMTSPDGATLYEGFCMEFLQKLAEYAGFDYQIVTQGKSVAGVFFHFVSSFSTN